MPYMYRSRVQDFGFSCALRVSGDRCLAIMYIALQAEPLELSHSIISI